MNLPLIIACVTIVLALIVFPLIVSFKAEKKNEKLYFIFVDRILKYIFDICSK